MDQLMSAGLAIAGRKTFHVAAGAECAGTSIEGELVLAFRFWPRSVSANAFDIEDIMALTGCHAVKAVNIATNSIAPVAFKCHLLRFIVIASPIELLPTLRKPYY
jgi:hypothetical protein